MKGRLLTAAEIAEFTEHLVLEERSAATVEKYVRDVRAFAAYAPDGTLPDPERTRALLQPTGRTDFPYYLPARRSLGLIVLDAGTIPDSIEKP